MQVSSSIKYYFTNRTPPSIIQSLLVSVVLHRNMNSIHLFPTPTLHFIVTIFFFLIIIPVSHCEDDVDLFSHCSSPYPYRCGSRVFNISYPFWRGDRPQYCGREGFEIRCENNEYHFIEFGTEKFRVLSINASRPTMITARDDLWNSYCPGIVTNHTFFDLSRFKYSPNVREHRFFHDCREEISPDEPNYFYCFIEGEVKITGFYNISNFPLSNLGNKCNVEIRVPVLLSGLDDLTRPGHLQAVLNKGFEVEYMADNTLCSDCNSSGGICGSNPSVAEQFSCFCPDHHEPQMSTCPTPVRDTNWSLGVKLVVGIVTAAGGLTIIFILICNSKCKNSSIFTILMFWKKTKNDPDLEAFIKDYGSLAPRRYSFSNVKKMTNSFKNKLGQGGYGGVYKGKLQDGQLVAVKLLNTSKGNGQEFINEVASISRTSHVNIVTLLGFCLEGNKRALIYEFMPNGSLEKFIHNNNTLKTNRHLGWEKLYQIALGIARGLEYLHRGCNTRIVHFDIKPHNILLDEDFCPKIADFGLAKLCPKKESIVSMLEARGTIGYIAPEIFIRNFGEISHKSDVYSFRMMVLEMVGGRKNLHLEVENSSEIYFPKWIYKHLELGEEIKLQEVMTSEENEIAKKMMIVGLWCIQTLPLERPSMNKVIDMLQGSTEALQIPPNPFHSSSPRPSLIDSTTISIS